MNRLNKLRRFKIFGAVFFFSLLSVETNAESRSISGIVLDSETNTAVPNTVVKILEVSRTYTCADDGTFDISELNYGTYTFVLNHIGYRENVSKIQINESTDKILAFYLIPKNIELDPVLVTDYRSFSKFDDLQELSNVLKGKELQKEMGLTLAATLKNEAGLAIRSMGPAPSRPVIRGLGSNRVMISEDGIKTVDLSATSPDHAVTIDPFTISRIEVLRGPKILTQTPTTIGGIVNVVREDIPEIIHNHLTGQFGIFGETVNKGYLGFSRLEIPVNPFVIKGEVSRRKTSDLDTPIGELGNSYSENLNYNLALSYIANLGYVGASFRRFELDYGVPGGFVGAHPNGVDIEIDKNQYNLKSKLNFENSLLQNLEFDLSRVYYRHKEFEQNGAIGSEFEVVNYLADIQTSHNDIGILSNGILGLSSEYRDFNIGGFVFTSPTKSVNLSAYLFENLGYGRFSFEFGARYNFDRISPENEKPNANIGYVRERTFNTYSVSLSALYQQSEHVFFGANISKSSRVPTIEELFSEGPHLAAYSYEIGNPDLDAESGIGTELFVYHKFENLYFNLTFFGNDIHDYIIPRNTGEINYSTFLPIYKTEGVEALLYGYESRIDWRFCSCFEFSNTISYTRGEFKDGGNLPQIPPLKGLVEIKYRSDLLNFGIAGEWAGVQNRVDDFEEKTDGYFVLNLFMQYSIISNSTTSNLSLSIDNVLNKEYRNHLSRVKSILPEAGRNFRLSYKMYFHL
jgi:iron complex outermembrane receptor protein